ncbi:unnamed protein product [Closterium sp. Naga37s-1]|nr:unnamed protein product [Closterium sp. Naga37s-1]
MNAGRGTGARGNVGRGPGAIGNEGRGTGARGNAGRGNAGDGTAGRGTGARGNAGKWKAGGGTTGRGTGARGHGGRGARGRGASGRGAGGSANGGSAPGGTGTANSLSALHEGEAKDMERVRGTRTDNEVPIADWNRLGVDDTPATKREMCMGILYGLSEATLKKNHGWANEYKRFMAHELPKLDEGRFGEEAALKNTNPDEIGAALEQNMGGSWKMAKGDEQPCNETEKEERQAFLFSNMPACSPPPSLTLPQHTHTLSRAGSPPAMRKWTQGGRP